jgi:proteasome lid subunit RPN8/RPN11
VRWNEKIFSSALDWLTQLKLTYNLAKSFPVWTNIRYNGVKLNQYKNMYIKKMSKMNEQFMEFTLTPSQSGEARLVAEGGQSSEEKEVGKSHKRHHRRKSEDSDAPVAKHPAVTSQTTPLSSIPQPLVSSHVAAEPSTEQHFEPQLLECAVFGQLGIKQPYKITFCKSAILLMNYHCQMRASEEVVGYLAGDYHQEDNVMSIKVCFPCRCVLSDAEKGQECEEKIQREIHQQGLLVVGWYHSHPDFEPRPTYQDVVLQKKYQNTVKTVYKDEPCVAFIINCRAKHKRDESNFYLQSNCFWVKSLDQSSGVPMLMEYTVTEDDISSIQDQLDETTSYYTAPDSSVDSEAIWKYCLASLPKKV